VALWSVGVLAYQLYFGSRPFPKYQPYSWSSRECFLAVNELQPPVRSPAAERARDFVVACLTRRVSAASLCDLMVEPFMGGAGK
jgi:hypothetical protein